MRLIVALLFVLLLPAVAFGQSAQPPIPQVAPVALFQGPPASDPTRLTSEQLFREVGTLEKSLNAQLAAIIKNADEFKANLTHFPTEVDQKIAQMEKLQTAVIRELATKDEERFIGIALQFKERDERVLQLSAGTKVAVDLALSAQKEQVVAQNLNITASLNEIKTTFGKLIDNQQQLQVNNTKALEDRIAAVKDQVTAITSHSSGLSDSWGYVGVVAGLLIGAGGLAFNMNSRRASTGNATPQVVYIPTPATLPTAPMPEPVHARTA